MRLLKTYPFPASRLMLAGLAVCMVAGCTQSFGLKNRNRQVFDGQTYSSRVSPNGADPLQFSVSVRNASSKGMSGALKAGEYAGTRYCIENFGESGINWLKGPNDPGAAIALDNGNLVMSGACIGWR